MSNLSEKRMVIACRVFEPEMEMLRGEDSHPPGVRYLDQGLHMTPRKMTKAIQEEIDQGEAAAAEIVLGYGLCSNGILGLKSSRPLVVPRCHDCISIFLGSVSQYKDLLKQRPGTFYLTPGWIREKKDPLGIVEEIYTPRVGRKTAVWGMKEELKHYTHIVFINTGAGDPESLRERTRENARFFRKAYEELPGDMQFIRKMFFGPYPENDFSLVRPGEPVDPKLFQPE